MNYTLRAFSTESMVNVGQRLLAEHRPSLEAFPMSAAMLPALQTAVDDLLSTQTVVVSPARLEQLAQTQRQTDDEHDRIARGVDRVLDGWARLTRDPAERAEIEALRQQVFPDGMQVTNVTWIETAGRADLLRKRLTPQDQDRLGQVRVAGATLATHVKQMLEQAAALDAANRERDRIEQEIEQLERPSRSEIVSARNQWIRTVNALLAVIELEDPDHQHTRAIFQLLDDASPERPTRQPTPTPEPAPADPQPA